MYQPYSKMKRADFDAAARPRPDYLDNLRKDGRKYQVGLVIPREQVMLSFTTDCLQSL